MATFEECEPGRQARILKAHVPRVVGKVGTIVEVAREQRDSTRPTQHRVTVDVPGHGEVVVTPAELDLI
ncbi:MAG: hypothetical protein ABI587_06020 [Gemmatimonadales bacterium]